jgi:hypothetical protein
MAFREFQESHPTLAMALAVALMGLLVGFVGWWFWPRSERERQQMAYFYDLNTGELLELPASTVGPVKTASGPYRGMPAGVRAHVYCCGPYLKGTEKFVGFLEVPLEALPEDQRPPGMKPNPDSEMGDLVIRRPGDEQWYDPEGPEGLRIMQELGARCPGDKRLNYLAAPARRR